MEIDLKSIAIGKIKNYSIKNKDFESAYKKDIFLNSAKVDKDGFIDDFQADKRYHGGEDKAIHIGSNTHLTKNPDFDKLFIGCNIIVEKLDEKDICVGDIYKIGEIKIQVTQPRHPCWKISAIFNKDINKYIVKNHATGWYAKVLKEGTINISDKMVLEKRVSNLTIYNLSNFLKNRPNDKRIINEILESEFIAQSYKQDFLKALDKK
ncbi:MOSC domain-containing protein [Malaciobacter molluscorum]|uniref:MOSC domain-containing protein n=1 Tax=Malaciobacter molluscorum TaxID=1032072 RepID=UPI00100A39D8|nr:MOSC domain-containing protein [Malaciobacter molluscorum]RXJ95656.1 MOSC domain-containing protein [Malaciobacter molluscorum]